ncbi:spore coat polysaccharide biosynthesis protein SpsF [Bradyrhizobium sp. GM24.11]
MTVMAILQARMSSRRLPGKVLAPVLGQPMIQRQIERIRHTRLIDRLVIATSAMSDDDAIAEFCRAIGQPCHRGPLDDVLGRFVGALDAYGPADHVVRLTADCPLIDWTIIDRCVNEHIAHGADCTSNAIVRSFPDGLDVEVMTSGALRAANAEARDAQSREHVTPFIYSNQNRFQIRHVTQPVDLAALRWTVDNPDDLAFVHKVYDHLYARNPMFTSDDILALPFGRRLAP